MKPLNPRTRAARAWAPVPAALVVRPRPTARDDHPATWHDPGESDAWADADAAEQYQELDAQARQVTRRLTEKVALAEALACGEEKLDEVAARFRELNGPGRDG